jgi:hypothetical protein
LKKSGNFKSTSAERMRLEEPEKNSCRRASLKRQIQRQKSRLTLKSKGKSKYLKQDPVQHKSEACPPPKLHLEAIITTKRVKVKKLNPKKMRTASQRKMI